MKIELTPAAIEWFENEVGVSPESGVRFLGKVYGKTNVHEGFSVGMAVGQPEDALVKEEINGVLYFIEKNDEWFFSGYDLQVDFNAEKDEPIYTFVDQED
ncbi:HesB/YadR/YfhF family protein [Carnobacterium mobile]|uniref:HesB/YadR/YfhF family protein n=1 Tax=Carnobacterium mobile TaxID=2750 RepID=UPI001866AF81|nr:iron-sulfur cluster biosynthesis protein [Carnobacterium mobile]